MPMAELRQWVLDEIVQTSNGSKCIIPWFSQWREKRITDVVPQTQSNSKSVSLVC